MSTRLRFLFSCFMVVVVSIGLAGDLKAIVPFTVFVAVRCVCVCVCVQGARKLDFVVCCVYAHACLTTRWWWWSLTDSLQSFAREFVSLSGVCMRARD